MLQNIGDRNWSVPICHKDGHCKLLCRLVLEVSHKRHLQFGYPQYNHMLSFCSHRHTTSNTKKKCNSYDNLYWEIYNIVLDRYLNDNLLIINRVSDWTPELNFEFFVLWLATLRFHRCHLQQLQLVNKECFTKEQCIIIVKTLCICQWLLVSEVYQFSNLVGV